MAQFVVGGEIKSLVMGLFPAPLPPPPRSRYLYLVRCLRIHSPNPSLPLIGGQVHFKSLRPHIICPRLSASFSFPSSSPSRRCLSSPLAYYLFMARQSGLMAMSGAINHIRPLEVSALHWNLTAESLHCFATKPHITSSK